MIKNEKVYKPFMCYCAKVIPLAFNESMSYYECICNITNHINNEIIPVVNENSDIVNQNKKDFDELKEYVDDNMLTKDVNDLTYYTLTSDLSSVATSGDYTDLINKPTIPDVSNFITKDVNDLTYYTLSSNLSSVATSGDYDDLLNKPTIPDVSNFITKDVNDLTNYTLTSNLSSVATSGDYNDLINNPTIPTIPTNVSSFNNDAGYITKNVNDLTNYTTTTSLTSLLSDKEDIIEYGSNTNGEYYKFASGLLICTKSASVTTAITSSWGVLYESSEAIDLGSFPTNFISSPIVNGNVCSQRSAFIESIYNITTSSWGYTYLVRPQSTNSNSYQLHLIAIGKWK